METVVGEIPDHRRKNHPVAALLQALLALRGKLLQLVMVAAGGARRRTSGGHGAQPGQVRTVQIDSHRGRDAQQRPVVHVVALAGIGACQDHRRPQAIHPLQDGALNRNFVQPHQQPTPVTAAGKVAGMDIETGEVRSQIGQRHKAGKDPEGDPHRLKLPPQPVGPLGPQLLPLRGGDRNPLLAIAVIELPDVLRNQRQAVLLSQLPGAAGLRRVGDNRRQVKARTAAALRLGLVATENLLGVGPRAGEEDRRLRPAGAARRQQCLDIAHDGRAKKLKKLVGSASNFPD